MRFSTPLRKGTLIKRYKRFLADVRLDNDEIIVAHCPNTGSMETCYHEGATVWLSPANNPDRKLRWTWEFTESTSGLIGINTALPNHIVAEAISEGKIPRLSGYRSLRQEVKYGKNSRIDILLEDDKRPPCYVEVKNTTLLRGDEVLFPDAVTSRGLKHLEELSIIANAGQRAVMLFFVNRPEGGCFRPADEIDKAYGAGLREAARQGVELIAVRAQSTPEIFTIGPEVPIKL